MRCIALLSLVACYSEPEVTCANEPIGAFFDADGDGYGGEDAGLVCEIAPGLSADARDCDDDDAAIHPGVDEACDGIDNNCNGEVDEGLVRLKVWYFDGDGDGFGAQYPAQHACGKPGEAWVSVAGDCNDADALVHPDATEVCNGNVDDNCDGLADDFDDHLDLSTRITYHRDADLDTYGNPQVRTLTCGAPTGYVLDDTDCNDNRSDVYPGAPEVCSGYDNDCDGLADDADPDIDVSTQRDFFVDADLDGYGAPGVSVLACSLGAGLVDNDLDCNDSSAALNLDDADNDGHTSCDGDCNDSVPVITPVDEDGDGFTACDPAADCSPFDGAVFPGANEIVADGIDQDCDTVDDCYLDLDFDGYGNGTVVGGQTLACNAPGEADNPDDCDDTTAVIIGPQDWYHDGDGDGYGGVVVSFGCFPQFPDNTSVDGDCDDVDPLIHPGAAEVCDDQIDHDCNGHVGCCDLTVEVEFQGTCYYLDGSGGNCDPGYVLAPQSILNDIASDFVGLDYKHKVSNNCCVQHADQATELQDWGMGAGDCNAAGPFGVGPVPGGAGCNDANQLNSAQLTLCQTQ